MSATIAEIRADARPEPNEAERSDAVLIRQARAAPDGSSGANHRL
jgi:hypothetical protein